MFKIFGKSKSVSKTKEDGTAKTPEEIAADEQFEAELKKKLSKEQYDVTRNHATERPFTNAYHNNKEEGIYKCVACGQEAYSSEAKYDSGTGWPSFYDTMPDAVGESVDNKLWMTRTEVHCVKCKSHQGHVFPDGPNPTGKRYCINSAALEFVPKK